MDYTVLYNEETGEWLPIGEVGNLLPIQSFAEFVREHLGDQAVLKLPYFGEPDVEQDVELLQGLAAPAY